MALPAAVTANLPVELITPRSTRIFAPEAKPSAFPVAVPILYVPCDILNRPVTVAAPLRPTTVKLGLFIQKPPVAGIAYAAELKTGLLNVLVPPVLNVPLVIVRNPTTFAPDTVKVPPGLKVRTGVLFVPLFKITPAVC